MGALSFKSSAAAEMVLRTAQGASCALEVVRIHGGLVYLRLNVTVQGEPVLISDEILTAQVGDNVHVPSTLEVQFSTI